MREDRPHSEELLIVAGMARSGTTFLYHHFQGHPEIFVPARKELGYFSYNYPHGENWYRSFFKSMTQEKCAVDISPAYFMDWDAPGRITDYGPRVRVILGIRDPLDWIYSMYGHYGDLFSVPAFREFLDGCTLQREGKEYRLEFGPRRIIETVENYRDIFGSRLLLFDFSLLTSQPITLLQEIEQFMGLSPYYSAENISPKKIHARGADSGRNISRVLNHVPGLATTISRWLPKKLLLTVRRKFETANSRKKPSAVRATADTYLTDEERHYAEDFFNADLDYYNTLFSRNGVIRS